MKLVYGPSIVTDGLVLCLDAANSKSYSGTGSAWHDMSNTSNDGVISNGTFNSGFLGGIVFNGTNTKVVNNNRQNVGNTFTINAWLKLNSLGYVAFRKTIISNAYPYTTGKGFFFVSTGNNGSDFFISLGLDEKYAISTTGYISTNTVYMLTARVNNSDLIQLFVNGVEVNYSIRTNGSISLAYDTGVFNIGERNNTTQDMFDGTIYNVQLYNRGLSPAEILQNYNAFKTRFILSQKLVGLNDAAADFTNLTSNYIVVQKYTAVASGTMTQFRVRMKNSGNIKVAIYSDSGGSPNTLLNSVGATAAVTGINNIAFPPTVITSGTDYWLAFNTETSNTYGAYNGGNVGYYRVLTFTSSFPDPAGAFSLTGSFTNINAGWG